MGAKSLDPQVLTTTMLGVIEPVLSKMTGIVATAEPETKELEIVDYEGRLRVSGVEKFNTASYISVINFYLNEKDKQSHKAAKGAMVLYVESENAGKVFKALGFSVPEDEDDTSMMDACGQFCDLLAQGFKTELNRLGYFDLVLSNPDNYRNSVLEGVEFSPDQKIKFEFSFSYWKHKAIIVEVTLADIPQKR